MKRDKRFYEQLVHDAAEASCKALNAEGYSPRPRHVSERLASSIFHGKERSRWGGVDDRYASAGNVFRGKPSHPDIPETPDFLLEIHHQQEQERANKDSPSEIQRIIRMSEQKMLILLEQSFDKKMLPSDFVQACEAFADLAVRDVLIEGASVDDMEYARQFLLQLRRIYGAVDPAMETITKLKRVEDKLGLGKEACVVMQKQVHRQHGVYDVFDVAMREIIARRAHSANPDDKGPPKEQELDAAVAYTEKTYQNTLRSLGLDNATPQHSYYTMALCQRAAYVAQAEFMRLSKGHVDRAGDNAERRNAYLAKRIPVLVKDVLEKYPPVAADDLKGQAGSENIYIHASKALFDAVAWLDKQRAQVASMGRAH